jgi:hypothetical protein
MAWINQDLLDCVGFLYIVKDDEKVAVGTCYFVCATSRYEITAFKYLVTCKHVWELLCGRDSYVRLNKATVLSSEVGIEWVQLPNTSAELSEPWAFHQDSGVDLAVLPMDPYLGNGKDVSFKCLELKRIVSEPNAVRQAGLPWPPAVGEEAFFVTMMTKFAGRERNYPLTRRGHVALRTDETIRGKYGLSDYYVIEAQCYPGNSGSPVWVTYDYYPPPPQMYRGDKQDFLLGTMTGGQSEEQEVIVCKKNEGERKAYLNLALGLVVPAEKLCDILGSKEQSRIRDEMDQNKDQSPPFVPLA